MRIVFKTEPSKAPGPDRLVACFLQKYWEIVGLHVIEMVKEFFHFGQIYYNLITFL